MNTILGAFALFALGAAAGAYLKDSDHAEAFGAILALGLASFFVLIGRLSGLP